MNRIGFQRPSTGETLARQPLERLFRCELEFHRRVRCEVRGQKEDAAAARESFGLIHGYGELIQALTGAEDKDIEAMKERLMMAGDTRDVLAACDSVKQLLGMEQLER
jgi:hypothetical protein